MRKRTPYGTIETSAHETIIKATRDQLFRWANRPGHRWPCSTLADAPGGWACFDMRGDLVDLSPGWASADLDGHELSAWESDVRAWEG